jgi:FKBP-type peptidyl-prolyl isomerase-like protein
MVMIKPGVELLSETLGEGPPVQRHKHYQIKLRMWLRQGEPVRWLKSLGYSRLEDDDTALITDVRVDRVQLVAGLFYGIQGMCVGGTRTLRIAPHLGYGEHGRLGEIPANALLTVEVAVLSERSEMNY